MAALEQQLAGFGDCVLVVGEAPLVKVHVHTDDPGQVLSLGVGAGSVDGIEIANMHEQARARERRLTVIEGGGTSTDGGGAGNRRRWCSTPPPTCPIRRRFTPTGDRCR